MAKRCVVSGQERAVRRANIRATVGGRTVCVRLLGIAGDLWLSLYDQGLLHSTDGGKTWTKVTGVEWSVQAAAGKSAPGVKSPTLFVYGQIGGTHPKAGTQVNVAMYRPIDAGKTWVRINPETMGLNGIGNLTADMQVFGRVYVGTGGRGFFFGEPVAAKKLISTRR